MNKQRAILELTPCWWWDESPQPGPVRGEAERGLRVCRLSGCVTPAGDSQHTSHLHISHISYHDARWVQQEAYLQLVYNSVKLNVLIKQTNTGRLKLKELSDRKVSIWITAISMIIICLGVLVAMFFLCGNTLGSLEVLNCSKRGKFIRYKGTRIHYIRG